MPLPTTLLLAVASPAQATSAPEAAPVPVAAPAPATHTWGADVLDPEVRAVFPRLKKLMRAGLTRTEPHTNFVKRETGESLFEGSYDWHSNLFAHWALLTIARVDGDDALQAELKERLNMEALAAERTRVQVVSAKGLPTFPYDQGWLLLVLTELERHYGQVPAELRAFRVEVETRLLDWLETSDFPARVSSRFESGRFPGFYRSWLFAFLQVRLSEPIGTDARARLDALQTKRVLPALGKLAAQTEPHPFDFFYVPAVPTLLHELAPFPDCPPALHTPELVALPEKVSLRDVHVLGTEISHTWPLAARARAGDLAAKQALNARLKRFLAREDLWAEDFTVVTHWVPQFLWFSFWLAEGRP